MLNELHEGYSFRLVTVSRAHTINGIFPTQIGFLAASLRI